MESWCSALPLQSTRQALSGPVGLRAGRRATSRTSSSGSCGTQVWVGGDLPPAPRLTGAPTARPGQTHFIAEMRATSEQQRNRAACTTCSYVSHPIRVPFLCLLPFGRESAWCPISAHMSSAPPAKRVAAAAAVGSELAPLSQVYHHDMEAQGLEDTVGTMVSMMSEFSLGECPLPPSHLAMLARPTRHRLQECPS